MTPEEFKQLLHASTVDNIVENYILSDEVGPYTTRDALDLLESRIRVVFELTKDQPLSTIVVGSAKLGFAYLEKPSKNGSEPKPAYRLYEPGVSDIDVAVVSPALYNKMWVDLARYGANQPYFPFTSKLSAYMFHGWIRQDKFPAAAPQRCNDWKRVLNELSRTPQFKYKQLRCAIYHSRVFVKIYQQRGVITAMQAEGVI